MTKFKAAAWVRGQGRNIALLVPLLLVNSVAFLGQVGWAQTHLNAGPVMPYVFASAVESLSLFLAAEAHAALMAGDAALRLRLGAYAVALSAGALNYAHWCGPGYAPTAAAVTFGALSTLSPVLWSIRSRSMHRGQLRAQGLIDPRTVRFSPARWVLYPRATFAAFRAAVWVGEQDPLRAIRYSKFAPSQAGSWSSDHTPEAVEEPTVDPVSREVSPTLQPGGPRETDRRVAAIAAEIRKGGTPTASSIQREHRTGWDTAKRLLAAAQEAADGPGNVVRLGGTR